MNEKVQSKSISIEQANLINWRKLAIGAIIFIVLLSLPKYCSGDCGHSHDDPHHHHHHVDEPASFKWSKQANEAEHLHDHHHHDHDHQGHEHHHHHPPPAQEKVAKQPGMSSALFLLTENHLIN